MKLIVVDASALVEYVLVTDLGLRVAPSLEGQLSDVHVPALCDIEVASALRGLVLTKRLPVKRAREAIADYAALPLQRHEHLALLDRVLGLAHNFSAYDATYVALAEALSAPLLTCDHHLATAVEAYLPHLRVDVVVD